MKISIFFFTVLISSLHLVAAPKSIDLSGTWSFALDAQDLGIKAPPEQWKFPDSIQLPGIVTAQGFGEKPNINTPWTGDGWRHRNLFKEWQSADNFKFPFFLQPPLHYVGPTWFQREIEIPTDWEKSSILLHLERVHSQSSVWIDRKKIGEADSLGTPHEFKLGSLKAGKHTLTIRVDNRINDINVGPLSHSVTDHTQGNWNGVVGKVELRARPSAHIEQIKLTPDAKTGKILVKVHHTGITPTSNATLTLHAKLRDSEKSWESKAAKVTGTSTEHEITIPDALLWDEFSPNLYQITATLNSTSGKHQAQSTCGFRSVSNKNGWLTLNDHQLFLRGTLECCIFPLTGHPPTDVDSWRRIIKICKQHGLNHIRFHSWCPPEAAFIAADELGFYYQVEASSWANQGAAIGDGRPLDKWIDEECARMLKSYGNHPSFLLMAYGNEPGGRNHRQWLQQWVARYKKLDPRRIYTTAAGWPLMSGSDFHSGYLNCRIQAWGAGMKSIINAQAPNTNFNWSRLINSYPDAPVVSHEIGQWCAYPNFEEIDKYTGYFKARNFEIFREMARRNGLAKQSRDFLMASGKLQTLLYKHDIEASLRTERMGGFQLLDLHDFPGQGTALVGVLDAFWDSKGYVTADEFKRFSGPIVPLANIKKMVFTSDETFEAKLMLSHFSKEDFNQLIPVWKLTTTDGKIIAKGQLSPRDLSAYKLHQLGSIQTSLKGISTATQLKFTVGALNQSFSNEWDIFVYPKNLPDNQGDILITTSLEKALQVLDQGKTVFWNPKPQQIANDPNQRLQMGFPTIFWNTAWTNWQPPHTLGILVDPKHKALEHFPTEFHSNWQWWQIQHQGSPFILTQHKSLTPIVQVIDDWVTNRRLGLVFEAKVGKGKLIASSVDMQSNLEQRPSVRQLRSSLLSYMNSKSFEPKTTLNASDLSALIHPTPNVQKIGASATASSSEVNYPASAAIDGDTQTLWHTPFTPNAQKPPYDLTLQLPKQANVTGLIFTQRQDNIANGQIKRLEILDEKGKVIHRATIPMNAARHTVRLPKATPLKQLTIRTLSSYSGSYASLAELDLITLPQK